MKKSYSFQLAISYGFTVLIVLSILLICVACPPASEPDNSEITQILSGTVRSLGDSSAIEGAVVTVGGSTVQTDVSGNFTLNVPGGIDKKIVSVTKNDFGSYSKSMSVDHNLEVVIEPYLVPADFTMIMDPSENDEHTFITTDGASVVFPDISSAGIIEDLAVTLIHYDVSSDELASVPGNFQGQETGGSTVNIVSQGMIEVRVIGTDTGNNYSFDGAGYIFDIVLPVTGDPAMAGGTIPLWYYDESTGLWIEEGTATKSVDELGRDVYVGSVTHFTTWNMDYKLPVVVSVIGTINDPDDDIYDITLEGLGFSLKNSITDKELKIINLPPNMSLTLTITKRSTGQMNITNFNSPSVGELDLGDLFENFYPFVLNLRILPESTAVIFNWTDPSETEYEGLEIDYAHEAGPTGLEFIPEGIQEYTLDGMPEGRLTLTMRARYTGGSYSGEIIRILRIGEYSLFSMQYDGEILADTNIIEKHLYYSFGLNTEFIEYTEPIPIPVGIEIHCMAEIVLALPDYSYFYEWKRKYEDNSEDSYYGEEISFLNDEGDCEVTLLFTTC